jgi:magnesium chelatase subunit I
VEAKGNNVNNPDETKTPVILPYDKIVGHQDLKLALEIAYIAGQRLGGVLVSGHRGTGKSTTVRSFAQMVYGTLPVTLPINATEDRVVGGWEIDALMRGKPTQKMGLMAQANGKILYIDEVNLLDDHIINVILDTAATGILSIQRQGLDEQTNTRFILVGTMNPEEGYLRSQLHDRFGLMVHIITHRDDRAQILQTVLAFEGAKHTQNNDFMTAGREKDEQLKVKLDKAQKRFQKLLDNFSEQSPIIDKCVALAEAFAVVGHRADQYLALAALALAAREEADAVTTTHLRDVAPLVLTHRREGRAYWHVTDNERVAELLNVELVTRRNLSSMPEPTIKKSIQS